MTTYRETLFGPQVRKLLFFFRGELNDVFINFHLIF